MKTTLIEAAQDVVTICKMYRTSLPLDVLSEVKSLEQAISQEQKRLLEPIMFKDVGMNDPVRGCETCLWVGRATDQAPCNNCTTNELFVDNWEPKP